MLFEARELKAGGEPVSPGELREDGIYFDVLFLDDDGFIPLLEPKVFIGRNLEHGDVDELYFQEFVSYRRGVRYESAGAMTMRSLKSICRTISMSTLAHLMF